MKNRSRNYIALGLLLSGTLVVFSGILIQIQYHIGHQNADLKSLGLDYHSWANVHKIATVILFILAIIHIIAHWKWYKTVVEKKLSGRNRQTVFLTLVFAAASITGFIPWIIEIADGEVEVAKSIVEVHDKIAIILSIFFVLHVMKRMRLILR